MYRITGAVSAALFVVIALLASPASAHTPASSADCNGVVVTGTSYESGDTNTLGIRLDDGTWITKQFANDGTLTVPVPQDGVAHGYDAYVHTTNSNSSYSRDFHGTVGPCGETPPPPPPVVHKAYTHFQMSNHCGCRRDSASAWGKHVSITKNRVRPTKWVFHITADPGWILASNGRTHQRVVKHTTNKPCPCKRNHTCHKKHPHAQHLVCRGRCH